MNAPIESPGPATSSSSPLASSTSPSSSLVVLPTGPGARFEAGSRFIFVELFAGTGALTHAVGKYVSTLPPQDLDLGGVDFSDFAAVRRLWDTWKQLADAGFTFIFHAAPPCASFSRARDRSHRTRLRSSASPGGLYPYDPVTKKGNAIARNTAASVDFLVSLGGSGSWEQPAGSYMLPYLDSVEGLRSPREAADGLLDIWVAPPSQPRSPLYAYIFLWQRRPRSAGFWPLLYGCSSNVPTEAGQDLCVRHFDTHSVCQHTSFQFVFIFGSCRRRERWRSSQARRSWGLL